MTLREELIALLDKHEVTTEEVRHTETAADYMLDCLELLKQTVRDDNERWDKLLSRSGQ